MIDFRKLKPDQINDAIVMASLMGHPGQAELLRGVRDHRIGLVQLDRDDQVSVETLKGFNPPLIVLIADDDYHSSGPLGWRSWGTLRSWATRGLVHGTGGTIDSYRRSFSLILECQRLLLIETSDAQAPEWAVALCQAGIITLMLLPNNGVHPTLPGKPQVQ